jgi:glucuronokinase
MDFSRKYMEQYGHGCYESIDPSLLPPLYIAYRTDLSEISGVFHSNIRARWEAGEKVVVDAMQHAADLALQGRDCILRKEYKKLGDLINENFDTRASIYRLDPRNVEMVMRAREAGASAHYAGSGGSIIGIYTNEDTLVRLRTALAPLGCRVIIPVVA